MSVMKILLNILLLIYLSGTFGLEKLNLGIPFEARYLLLFAFLTMIVGGLLSRKTTIPSFKKSTINTIIPLAIYVFAISISMFHTPNMEFAIEKFISIIFLLVLALATILMVSIMEPKEFFLHISSFFVLVGAVYSIPVIFDVITGSVRGDVGFSGPNVATRIFFFAACSSLFLYTVKKKNIYFFFSLIFFASIMMVGSRGGLIGSFLVLVYLFLVKKLLAFYKTKKRIRFTPQKLLLVPLILLTVYLLYEPVKVVFLERIIYTTFQSTGEVYTSGRDIIYGNSIDLIKERPLFGHGVEAFAVKTGAVYPHNLLLEMSIEIGLVGILIFFTLVLIALRLVFRMKKSPLFIFSGIPLYMIVVQMFSGDFYDFRYFFLWLIPLTQYSTVKEDALKGVPGPQTIQVIKERVSIIRNRFNETH